MDESGKTMSSDETVSLNEKWQRAVAQSNRRFNNKTFIMSDQCVDKDGVFCIFLRQMNVQKRGLMILFTRCVFHPCIKRYPEAGDYEELK